MTRSYRRLGLSLTGRGARADRIVNPARKSTGLVRAFALVVFALIITAPLLITPTLAELPAADKAAFYRMRKQAIERSLQDWRRSTMPGAPGQIARLEKEAREIDAKLNPGPPRPNPPASCRGCPAIDPDWCGLNCTGR
jgi:hypothetical protein